MNEIILNGVSLEEIRKQQNSLHQAGTKFISDQLALVQDMMEDLEGKSLEYAEGVAKSIEDILDQVLTVSSVTGVQYDLDYYDNRLSNTIDMLVDESGEGWKDFWKKFPKLSSLHEQLQDMENTVSNWNSSSC